MGVVGVVVGRGGRRMLSLLVRVGVASTGDVLQRRRARTRSLDLVLLVGWAWTEWRTVREAVVVDVVGRWWTALEVAAADKRVSTVLTQAARSEPCGVLIPPANATS